MGSYAFQLDSVDKSIEVKGAYVFSCKDSLLEGDEKLWVRGYCSSAEG